jgi:hypothetical protein
MFIHNCIYANVFIVLPALGPIQPPIQWVSGAVSMGVKRPGREAEHLPPSSAEVKNAWSYTSTQQYTFIAWCLVKNKHKATLLTLWCFVLPVPISQNIRKAVLE